MYIPYQTEKVPKNHNENKCKGVHKSQQIGVQFTRGGQEISHFSVDEVALITILLLGV
jgi:hypothetical protein